jgi:DNA-binding MarR family transcriptional regulator
MAGSTLASERRIGRLLGLMLRLFRTELMEWVIAADPELRHPHYHVFSNIDACGTRLTELAARAQLALSSMAELVDELEALGYLERVPDATDGRAKLVCLTERGRRHYVRAVGHVRSMEKRYASRVGEERYEAMCQTLHDLTTSLLYADLHHPDDQKFRDVSEEAEEPPADAGSSSRVGGR